MSLFNRQGSIDREPKQRIGIEYGQFGQPVFRNLRVYSCVIGFTQLNYVQYKGRCYSVAPEYIPGYGECLTIRDEVHPM